MSTAHPPPGLSSVSTSSLTVKHVRFANISLILAFHGAGRIGQWVRADKEGAEFDTACLLGDRDASLLPQLVARRVLASGALQEPTLLLGLGLTAPLNESTALSLCNSLIEAVT